MVGKTSVVTSGGPLESGFFNLRMRELKGVDCHLLCWEDWKYIWKWLYKDRWGDIGKGE